jgi:tetratricopeptide (TPR) repeat protein
MNNTISIFRRKGFRIFPVLLIIMVSSTCATLKAKKDYDRAIAEYTEAILIDPDNAFHYSSRGHVYRQNGDYDRAIADYAEAIRLEPNDDIRKELVPDVYFYWAFKKMVTNQVANQIRVLDDVVDANVFITMSPAMVSVSIRQELRNDISDMAKLYKQQKLMEDIHEILKSAVEGLEDENIVITDQCGSVLNNFVCITLMIEIYKRCIQAFLDRGNRSINICDYDFAIADYTEAMRFDSNYEQPYRDRAYAYMQKGNYTQARADVDMALQISPDYQSAQTLSAELRERGY